MHTTWLQLLTRVVGSTAVVVGCLLTNSYLNYISMFLALRSLSNSTSTSSYEIKRDALINGKEVEISNKSKVGDASAKRISSRKAARIKVGLHNDLSKLPFVCLTDLWRIWPVAWRTTNTDVDQEFSITCRCWRGSYLSIIASKLPLTYELIIRLTFHPNTRGPFERF